MKRSFRLILLAAAFLVTLLTACTRTPPGTTSLTIGLVPGDALVTVASDLDGSVAYEGPGGVTLTGLSPGPYVVMAGEGDAMEVQFVTLGTQGSQRVTFNQITPMARGGNPGKPDNPGGGGGGHTTTATNNLSFPVIWAENGASMTVPGTFDQPKLTTPYDITGDGAITDADMAEGYYQFAQKVTGNVWQAESAITNATLYVSEVDWGDSLESIDGKLGRPLRIELTLYKLLSETYSDEAALPPSMVEFPMTMLANASSPDEVQGAGASAYPIDLTVTPPVGNLTQAHTVAGGEATVYSSTYGLLIQPLVGLREDIAEGDLAWDGEQWIDGNATDPSGVEAPLSGISFASELNVGGKVIYGLSQGGWKPRAVGDYRLTFFLDPTKNTQLDHATVRLAVEEEEEATVTAEPTTGGTAVILGGPDPVTSIDRNLTYIDIRIVGGGGGGKRK